MVGDVAQGDLLLGPQPPPCTSSALRTPLRPCCCEKVGGPGGSGVKVQRVLGSEGGGPFLFHGSGRAQAPEAAPEGAFPPSARQMATGTQARSLSAPVGRAPSESTGPRSWGLSGETSLPPLGPDVPRVVVLSSLGITDFFSQGSGSPKPPKNVPRLSSDP